MLTDNHQFIYSTDFLNAIRRNKRNCVYLVFFLVLILIALGYLMGAFWEYSVTAYYSPNRYMQTYYPEGKLVNPLFEVSRMGLTGAFIAFGIALLWTTIAVSSGSKLLLFSANANQITQEDNDYLMLRNVVEEVSIAAGISPPKLYVIETDELNAFATGMSPKNSAVAITRGLLRVLNRDELQGVVAHEIGHVINFDIRYQTMVSIIVGLIVLLSDIAMRMVFYSGRGRSNHSNKSNAAGIIGLILLVFSIIAPIAALMLQMAVSRQREYMADATSVKLTRNPLGLISALGKLGAHARPFEGASKANQNLFIVNPFRNVAKLKSSLLATHPPLEDRIERLKNLK